VLRPEDEVVPFRPRMVELNPEIAGARERRERMEARAIEAMNPRRLQSVQVSARVRALVQELDATSFEAREAAVAALLDAAIDDAEVWAMLDRGGLGDESHERLVQVAVRRAQDKPRAALGVSMAQAPADRGGVLIQSTVPGLPADGVLQAGDVIERINDTPVRSSEEVADVLEQFAPGTEVRLIVVRAERDPKGRPLVGPDGRPAERRREFRMALGNAIELERGDPGVRQVPGMRGQNIPLDRRRAQAAIVQRRFTRRLPEAIVVPPAGDAVPAQGGGIVPGPG
jgi:PDZ domain